jgi:hypothetical protein
MPKEGADIADVVAFVASHDVTSDAGKRRQSKMLCACGDAPWKAPGPCGRTLCVPDADGGLAPDPLTNHRYNSI